MKISGTNLGIIPVTAPMPKHYKQKGLTYRYKSKVTGKTRSLAYSVELGEGSFAKVFLAYDIDNLQEVFALKKISMENMEKTVILTGGDFEDQKAKLKKEIKLLELVDRAGCKNVAGMIEHKPSQNNYYLIMEPANCGDLFGFVGARGGFLQEKEAQVVMRQLVAGFNELMEISVIHRDMRTENVLVYSDEIPDSYLLEKARGKEPTFDI